MMLPTERAEKPAKRPRPTSASGFADGHAITSHLETLRNANKLAIHVCEYAPTFKLPEHSLGLFSHTAPENIAVQLEHKNAPLFSISLLPNDRSGFSIEPWAVNRQVLKYCYLLDLDQDKEHPARVMCANAFSVLSGSDAFKKEYWGKEVLPEIKALYKGYPSQDAWVHAHTSDLEKSRELGKAQLGMVAKYYEDGAPDQADWSGPGVKGYNEMLVAASRQHIAAIAIPYNPHPANEVSYKPLHQLTAALAGLQHLDWQAKGNVVTDDPDGLPVVSYNVCDRDGGVHKGGISFIGKGLAQLTDVALKAIGELEELKGTPADKLHDDPRRKDLFAVVEAALGIDMSKPLAEQAEQVKALRQASDDTAQGHGGPRTRGVAR